MAGWAGSRPVRVGNDAGDQVQHDSDGLLLEGISVYLQTRRGLEGATWGLVPDTADRAATAESGPTAGSGSCAGPGTCSAPT